MSRAQRLALPREVHDPKHGYLGMIQKSGGTKRGWLAGTAGRILGVFPLAREAVAAVYIENGLLLPTSPGARIKIVESAR